jgi:hypothetical protein
MKKLSNPIQKALNTTAVIAFVYVIGQCGSLEKDNITILQCTIRCAIALIYIGIVIAINVIQENKKAQRILQYPMSR